MASQSKNKRARSSFEFLNVTHPAQGKDRDAKRKIFSHAMRDHLRQGGSNKARSLKGTWIAQPANASSRRIVPDVRALQELQPSSQRSPLDLRSGPSARTERVIHEPSQRNFRSDHLITAPQGVEIAQGPSNVHESSPILLSVLPGVKLTDTHLTPLQLVQHFSAQLVSSSSQDLAEYKQPCASYTTLKQDLLQIVQSEVNPTSQTSLASHLCILCLDLYQGDKPSLESHRLGVEALLPRLVRHYPQPYNFHKEINLFSALVYLTNIFLEQPSTIDFDLPSLSDTDESPHTFPPPFSFPSDADSTPQPNDYFTPPILSHLHTCHNLIQPILQPPPLPPTPHTNPPPTQHASPNPHPNKAHSLHPLETLLHHSTHLLTKAIHQRIPLSHTADPSLTHNLATILHDLHPHLSTHTSPLQNVLAFLLLLILPTANHTDDVDDSASGRYIRARAISCAVHGCVQWPWVFLANAEVVLGVQRWLGDGHEEELCRFDDGGKTSAVLGRATADTE